MSGDLSIPDDLAQRTARLVNEIEDQLAAAQADKKQVYADLREELKDLGMAGANISKHVAAFKAAISELRMTPDEKAKSVDKDDQTFRYVEIIKAASRAGARARTREAEATAAGADIETGEFPDSDVTAEGVEIMRAKAAPILAGMDLEIIEPHSAPALPLEAAADSDGGVDAPTVAPIQPAEAAPPPEVKDPSLSAPGIDDAGQTEGLGGPVAATSPAESEPVAISAPHSPAPLYPEPGIIVMEKCPPRGIVAHPYAACWPVKPIDVADGVLEPIVKIEQFILDGRGRYFAARDAGIEYPVVQYAGTDPLLDSIRWNLASRPGRGEWLRIVAHKLCKLEPGRADEIMSAMGLAEERAAAE